MNEHIYCCCKKCECDSETKCLHCSSSCTPDTISVVTSGIAIPGGSACIDGAISGSSFFALVGQVNRYLSLPQTSACTWELYPVSSIAGNVYDLAGCSGIAGAGNWGVGFSLTRTATDWSFDVTISEVSTGTLAGYLYRDTFSHAAVGDCVNIPASTNEITAYGYDSVSSASSVFTGGPSGFPQLGKDGVATFLVCS